MSSHSSDSNPCSFCGEHQPGEVCILKLLKRMTGGDSFYVRKAKPEPEYVQITFKLYLSG